VVPTGGGGARRGVPTSGRRPPCEAGTWRVVETCTAGCTTGGGRGRRGVRAARLRLLRPCSLVRLQRGTTWPPEMMRQPPQVLLVVAGLEGAPGGARQVAVTQRGPVTSAGLTFDVSARTGEQPQLPAGADASPRGLNGSQAPKPARNDVHHIGGQHPVEVAAGRWVCSNASCGSYPTASTPRSVSPRTSAPRPHPKSRTR
jgi:hypothetical protein